MGKCIVSGLETDYTLKGTNYHVQPFQALYEGEEMIRGYAAYLDTKPEKPLNYRGWAKERRAKINEKAKNIR